MAPLVGRAQSPGSAPGSSKPRDVAGAQGDKRVGGDPPLRWLSGCGTDFHREELRRLGAGRKDRHICVGPQGPVTFGVRGRVELTF